MKKAKSAKLGENESEYERFERFAKQIISVPKSEIDKREAEYQKARKAAKKRKAARRKVAIMANRERFSSAVRWKQGDFMFKKASIAFSAICVFVLCCGFGLRVAESRTQDLQTVNITVEDYRKAFQNKEPVKIVGLYLGTTSLKSGEDFQADKDWLRDLRIVVKNVSDQSIRETILNLDLPTNDPNVGIRRIEIHYGRGYFYSRTPSTTVPDVLLPPGELATIPYSFDVPNTYATLMSHLSQDHHYSLPGKGTLFLGAVVFEDIEKGWYTPKYVLRSGDSWTGDLSKPYSIMNQPKPSH